jgi:hypothetical protein
LICRRILLQLELEFSFDTISLRASVRRGTVSNRAVRQRLGDGVIANRAVNPAIGQLDKKAAWPQLHQTTK